MRCATDDASQPALIRDQARACAELGSPMYAELLGRLADDLEAGGPTAVGPAWARGRPRSLRASRCGWSAACTGSCSPARRPSSRRTTRRSGGAWSTARRRGRARLPRPAAGRRSPAAGPATADQRGRPVGRPAGRAAAVRGTPSATGSAVRDRSQRGPQPVRRPVPLRRRQPAPSWGDPDSPVVLADAWRRRPLPLDGAWWSPSGGGATSVRWTSPTEDGRLTLASYVWPDMTARYAAARRRHRARAAGAGRGRPSRCRVVRRGAGGWPTGT